MNSFHVKLVHFRYHVVIALLLSMTLGFGTIAKALAAATPEDGLVLLKKITVAPWTATGANTQTSTDIWSFDPSTNTIYFADRVNQGVTAIDTTTNTLLGTLKVPTCNDATTRPGSCPSGVQVAPELHKLVVTDRNKVLKSDGSTIDLKSIFIFDLRLLSKAPTQIVLPLGTNTDELDYDPINHRAYVGNTAAPFFVTVVDVLTETLVGQIPLPGAPEQPRFNPVDGFVYVTVPGAPTPAIVRIDTTKPDNTGAGKIVATLLTPTCDNRAIDIDPLTNDAFVGCAAPGGQLLVNLNGAMSIVNTFPGVTGTDTGQFNSNLRRFYTASSNNLPANTVCAANAASPSVAPVVGVFSAPTKSQPLGALVGADCSGTNGHDIGVDPVHNQVYVAVRQGPASLDPTFPANLANGNPGVLVWHDPAPLAQPEIIEESSARLAALTSQGANGRVLFADSHIVRARLSHLPAGDTALLNVTTTIGNEVVSCDKDGSSATCDGVLKGEALIGGNVLMSTGGAPLASGKIRHGDGGFGDDDHGEHHGRGHDD
jgi:hypothetical protein